MISRKIEITPKLWKTFKRKCLDLEKSMQQVLGELIKEFLKK